MRSLPSDYQNFIHASRYAHYRYDLGRREVHEESISRYLDFMVEHLARNHRYRMPQTLYSELEEAITGLHVMPSMRALMTAGPALERCHVGAYNCSALPIDSLRSFDEALYILMCGAGVGFSVEGQFIDKLPPVSSSFERSSTTIVVADSKEGWGHALRQLIEMFYAGQVPGYDTSRVRPKGSVLRTFGGRASGPEPLVELFPPGRRGCLSPPSPPRSHTPARC